ncbi:amidohydrolase [Phenylobacterium sp. J426]|uniref:amidohydrolase family protein n=1 Tax=Phenylobacterium sp. J426 TaxID=2898439 RepID=UPI002151F060|nr:amidohydrolase [Phenylobacterium sp. J426]MCR5876256.1 amidohydrolase [Phenylobacterium sp. J426]
MRRLTSVAAALVLFASAKVVAAQPMDVATDHHMHVHSPEILAMLPAYCESPLRKRPCDPAFVNPLSVADALAALDAAGVRRGWLMSTGYLAESALMGPVPADAPQRLHAANAFTVGQARAHPDRLVAFIGLNPLTETALAEIAAWRADRTASGIKLHLTNSGVDLRSPADVARLKAVVRAAAEARFAIMIHMRTSSPDYGREDAQTFIREVLPEARGVPLIIAHSAGWGGIDAPTLAALGAFADVIAHDPMIAKNLWFDLAQVYRPEATPADRAAFSALLRRIGPERFVTASDWPFAGDLRAYYEGLAAETSLTAAEVRAIGRSKVPLPRDGKLPRLP